MLVDFQHHYTPPELMVSHPGTGALRLDEGGNPNYQFNSLLSDVPAHLRAMDYAGIDAAVLSCGSGFDQPDLRICRLINDRLSQIERDHPGRFFGLAHVPALDPVVVKDELRRCAVDLGFSGVVIASELQGQPLNSEQLRPFWKAAADLGLYVFIHPLPRVIAWAHMDADDLGRMLGWEFSLMVAAARIINCGLLDDLPSLKIRFAHFCGGIDRYLPRIRGLQDRASAGTANLPRHGRQPRRPFDYYLRERLYYDCCGWTGRNNAAENGSEWIRAGLSALAPSQCVFGTDYPQAVEAEQQLSAYVDAVKMLGPSTTSMLDGSNANALLRRTKWPSVKVV